MFSVCLYYFIFFQFSLTLCDRAFDLGGGLHSSVFLPVERRRNKQAHNDLREKKLEIVSVADVKDS